MRVMEGRKTRGAGGGGRAQQGPGGGVNMTRWEYLNTDKSEAHGSNINDLPDIQFREKKNVSKALLVPLI